MFRDMRPRSRALIAATTLGLIAAPLTFALTAQANPGGTGLVIKEVYGGGGNSGAPYNADFVELYNPTASPISVDGYSIQYRAAGFAAGGTPSVLTLPNKVVPANDHFLVAVSPTGATGAALTAANHTDTALAMAAGAGQVILSDDIEPVTATGNLANVDGVVDMVGYGTTATSFETARTTANLSATLSASRTAGTDTDNNAADFTTAAPSPTAAAGDTTPPALPDFAGTIAEIQGTGKRTAQSGARVTTDGVVTAAYPTGGIDGFYMQTPGADTPDASDAIFVYLGSTGTYPSVGDHVQVVGQAGEFGGVTQITPGSTGSVTALPAAAQPVIPLTTLPGAGCAEGSCPSAADLRVLREAHEGEVFDLSGRDYTVSNSYSLTNAANGYMEIGLAADTKPLIAPTEVIDAQNAAAVAARTAYNNARGIVLDDGASANYTIGDKNTPMPWITKTHSVRVGADATFTGRVVLDYRNGAWKIQPTTRVTGLGEGTVAFAQTRAANAAPANVGGNLKLGTFNVLNYFNTTGQAWVASGGGRSCSYFNDREGNPITNQSCTPNGPRGAARTEDFLRQQAKIVSAINTLDADIVSLEEIENSIALGEADRDDAVSTLVAALNSAAGSTRWAYAASPAEASEAANVTKQDVIRTAFIYDPSTVELVGGSDILFHDDAAFNDAREPLAQAFKAKGADDADAFGVIVNHFKSKGSGTPDPDGQGNADDRREAQATSLVTFANDFKTARGITKIFLTGDFNAYSEEDPIQILEAAGYTNLESDTAGEESYSFSGLSGSLDHVFANAAVLPDVKGVDIWDINASESIAYQYSRFNYNVSDFFDGNSPWSASDHNPEIVGFKAANANAPKQLQLLGVNDFHGRINANTVKWAGTVEKLTADAGDTPTLMVGAGDLIGASEFASAVDDDQPTIDVLNALGLDASAVGNHEFDQGWADLRDDVIGSPGARNAKWDYLGANVYAKGTTDPVLPEYAMFDMDGVDVAVVGAVTQETGSLVSPGGITDIEFGNPVDAVNRVARELSDGNAANGEADVVVASFHAGAQLGTSATPPGTYESEVAKGGEFAEMANLDPAVDVIFNGHTHQVYAWDAPVPGVPGKTRPILQTGEYAANVGKVTITYDPVTGEVTAYSSSNVARVSTPDADLVTAYPRVAQVKQIVDAALANAATVGNQPVGQIDKDVTRAFSNGSYVNGKWVSPTPRTEDRGSESTLGDLIANALRDGLPADIDADLGIVNPGGMRADLTYAGSTGSNPANTDGVVTYAEANAVLPFVNNIWTVDLTGAQLKEILEQQWQTNPGGPAPSRPFLALGLSDNVRVTQDATKPEGSRITSVLINGERLDPAHTYTVSTFSFLGTGGDNFRAFTKGTHQDTGLVDRDLWIKYLQDNKPAVIDFARQQVETPGMPSTVYAGQHVQFSLAKLNLTSLGSPENTTLKVTAKSGSTTTELDPIAVTNGSATVDLTVPGFLTQAGAITFVAQPSGTTVTLPIGTKGTSTVSATADPIEYGDAGQVDVTVTPSDAAGTVELVDGDTVIGDAVLVNGVATIDIDALSLAPRTYRLAVRYVGDATHDGAVGYVTVVVNKATPTVTAVVNPTSVKVKKGTSTVDVTVGADGFTPGGSVAAYVDGVYTSSAPLTDGKATLTVGPFDTVGTKSIVVKYFGDDHTLTGSDATSVTVQKAAPKVRVSGPTTAKIRNATPKVTVNVSADGIVPNGTVVFRVDGRKVATKSLSGGAASFKLNRFYKLGRHTVEVTYQGSSLVESGKGTHVIRAVR